MKNKDYNDEIAAEYDFSKGVRGKHYQKLTEGYTVTIYSPNKESYQKQVSEKVSFIKIDKDVNEFFKSSEDVNNALRAIIMAIPKSRKVGR